MPTNSIIPPTAIILVAVMNNIRDLEIARLLGWYRIPLRSAPKVIAVDYLAFYQTSAFAEEKWCIKSFARVLGNELTTRYALLKEEADHPAGREEYYKIQIGPVEQLARPIPAGKWRRITFFYTTGSYLQKAQTINDLIVHDDERRLLWQTLRERTTERQGYTLEPELPAGDLDINLLSKLFEIRDALDDKYE